jgi:hypothetical protein
MQIGIFTGVPHHTPPQAIGPSLTVLRKDHLHALLSSSAHRPGSLALSLAVLGLAALTPSTARAQTQDLFVSNGGNTLTRFAGIGPGTFSTIPTTLTAPSLDSTYGLTFDARGDLFTANLNTGTITEFAAGATPGTLGAGTTFATGLSAPLGLAVDGRGDLFAGSLGGSITEFAFNSITSTFGAGTTFASGLFQPIRLATDARGDLFAASYGDLTIKEFASTGAGTFGPAQTVENYTRHPVFLAFNPVPAVPESPTTVSLGLLLALGMGGLVVAGRRPKA